MKRVALVVDNGPANLKLIAEVMSNYGFEVLTASDPIEAYQILQKVTPDIMLIDVGLRGIDGFGLIKKLKADVKTKDIGIVGLTRLAIKRDQEKAAEAGCDASISKPIDTRALLDEIAAVLDRSKSAEGSRRE
jgi:CheY-like chemotaxis protein